MNSSQSLLEASFPSQPKASALRVGERSRVGVTVLVAVPIVLVLVTFLFWYQTWFGRTLSDEEIGEYLSDTSVSHKTQHALVQLAERIARGDSTVKRWYPQIIRLAGSRETGFRLMAAWVMGQDSKSEEFHQALRHLVEDPELMVRWNAALALARFDDASGEPQLRLMLRPYSLAAPAAGTVAFRLKDQDTVRGGSIVARIRPKDGAESVEVLSPLAGKLMGVRVRDGSTVRAGEEIAAVSPADEQMWESLRALYLVGGPDDLEDVERIARGEARASQRVRQQAALTAQAIRRRATLGKTSSLEGTRSGI